MKESTRQNIILKVHLIISVIVVIPTAIIYGFFPDAVANLGAETTDEHSFDKAIMGIYLGFSALWFLGLIRKDFLKSALISNTIFMLGLGLGRMVSFALDGIPTEVYLYGTFAELFLGLYGLGVLVTYHKKFI